MAQSIQNIRWPPFLVETEKHRSVLLYPVHSGVKCQTWLGICLTISGMGQIEPTFVFWV